MTTLDFELEIGPGAAGSYQVVARAPGGEAATTLQWSVTLAELDHQLVVIKDKVLVSSVVVRRAPTEREQPVRELGRRLFETVIIDDVRALYVASKQRARDQGSTLRLVLRVRPPELARLPWVFLSDPGQGDYLGLTMPLVRYPQVLAPRQPVQVAPPLRILGMVARPGDLHALDAGEEQQRLQTALADLQHEELVELEWVAGQTYNDLEDALDEGPWHVFHFIGHGGYDRAADEGVLALADETGRTHLIGADDISRLLAEHHPLRLVVLNACDTGRGSAADAFTSAAAALIRREIPAVVAMQFGITDSAAIRFTQTFTSTWPNADRSTTASCAPGGPCDWPRRTPWNGALPCSTCALPTGASSTPPWRRHRGPLHPRIQCPHRRWQRPRDPPRARSFLTRQHRHPPSRASSLTPRSRTPCGTVKRSLRWRSARTGVGWRPPAPTRPRGSGC